MQCNPCSRHIVTAFLRDLAGIRPAPADMVPFHQHGRASRNARCFSSRSPCSPQISHRRDNSTLATSRGTRKDDTYVPFDSQTAAPQSSATAEFQYPSPFTIPNPPVPDEERSRIGHLKDPYFKPEIQVQDNETLNEMFNDLTENFPVGHVQDPGAHRQTSKPGVKSRSGHKSHEERLAKWRERNGLPEPQKPSIIEAPAPPHQPKESVWVKVSNPPTSKPTPTTNKRIRQATNTRPPRVPTSEPPKQKENWQIQKAALLSKFAPVGGWAPHKRLSPDALEGIRALHSQYPLQFPTPVLAAHFKVSPEAIRRILKSKWRPNADEEEERRERWDRRGVSIWKGLVEKGVHPPKRWREMGIGAGGPRRGREEWLRGVRERDVADGSEREDDEVRPGVRSVAVESLTGRFR